MSELSFSRYQTNIFDAIKKTKSNIVVEAVAGSGKTTTIVEALRLFTPMDKVLFLAFNKKIVEDLSKRTTQEVSTFHSLGLRAIRNNKKVFVKDTTWRLCEEVFEEKTRKVFPFMKKLLSLYKATLADPLEIIDFYGMDMPKVENAEDKIRECIAATEELRATVNFDDMLYYPVIKDWMDEKYDVVFVDEAQDLSPIQLMMLQKMRARRYIFVGDRHQSIYGFRGAQVDSIPNIIEEFQCESYPLSISYRCPERIVKRAQTIVPQIEHFKAGGEVIFTSNPRYQLGDLVLCRCTAPLVKECLSCLSRGIQAHVVGQEQDLQKSWELVKPHGIEGYRKIVYEKYKGVRLGEWIDTLDTLQALEAFDPDVEMAIEKVFSHTQGIVFMTIHRSKGLESDNVYILKPELLPHPNANTHWEIQQENNLHYVAITRAKEKLIYVTEEKYL